MVSYLYCTVLYILVLADCWSIEGYCSEGFGNRLMTEFSWKDCKWSESTNCVSEIITKPAESSPPEHQRACYKSTSTCQKSP